MRSVRGGRRRGGVAWLAPRGFASGLACRRGVAALCAGGGRRLCRAGLVPRCVVRPSCAVGKPQADSRVPSGAGSGARLAVRRAWLCGAAWKCGRFACVGVAAFCDGHCAAKPVCLSTKAAGRTHHGAFSRRLAKSPVGGGQTLISVLISVPCGNTSRPLMPRSFISMMKLT